MNGKNWIFSLLFIIALIIIGCGKVLYRGFHYQPVEKDYQWGRVSVSLSGKKYVKDQNLVVYASPYSLILGFKIYQQVPGCTVSLGNLSLVPSGGDEVHIIASPSQQYFKPDVSRSRASKFIDRRDWSEAFFSFKEVELKYVDYTLVASFVISGSCSTVQVDDMRLPIKRNYYEGTDSIWEQ